MSDTIQFDCHPLSIAYVEGLLHQAAEEKTSLPPSWRSALRPFAKESLNGALKLGPSFTPRTVFDPASRSSNHRQQFQRRVGRLVEAYRRAGHRAAQVDPLGLQQPDESALAIGHFGLRESDLDNRVSANETLRELIKMLRATYCGAIAYQVSHIHDPQIRDWLLRRIEQGERPLLATDQQRRILTRLIEVSAFDTYLRKKYLGAKTFSLEGAESLIVLLDEVVEQAAATGIDEVVMGMAHRGRLNVLTHVIGKPASAIFREFEDHHPEEYLGGGDVKYHLGASGNQRLDNGRQVHISLCFNSSHLEFVGPVALGRMRAKQDRAGDTNRERGLVLLIHGDAAFSGEGIVQESLNLSQLADYHVGGALHVILNNQIGFTTSPPHGRSTRYASDVACLLQSPILRVNADRPDAVLWATALALDYRRAFQRDVVIDLICYRRWGHNESDEPSFTQPRMYQAIEHMSPLAERFANKLIEQSVIAEEDVDDLRDAAKEHLREHFKRAREDGEEQPGHQPVVNVWDDYRGGSEPEDDDPDTGVDMQRLAELLRQTTRLPSDFHPHAKLRRAFEQRQRMARGEELLDWAAAEALAFASLAADGYPVRLAGQDAARGTFSQRHAVLHDVLDGHTHSIFGEGVRVINSPLSEAGAMGFEYGYSLDHPRALVIWEAQFGDFVNAAQVMIDQFLSSAEDKWNRLSGLVLLLPHGFEGQGPEHSSARLERLLTLAAEDNLQIVQPSTPAQYFHCLRRQALRRWRKPLVVLTPKSLLRHQAARSSLEELSKASFQRVLVEEARPSRRLLLCSGKMYYDLVEARRRQQCQGVAIARIEQFYPLSDNDLRTACRASDVEPEVCWVQEEPENMGAWPYWKQRFGDRFPWQVIARPVSASPATGSKASHKLEQDRLLARALGNEEQPEQKERRHEH